MASDKLESDSRKDFTLLEWNIQGLESEDLEPRMVQFSNTILQYLPDVAMLQEVTYEILLILKRELSDEYLIVDQVMESLAGETSEEERIEFAMKHSYFVAMLVRRKTTMVLATSVRPFSSSHQRRYLLQVTCGFKGNLLSLMTAHLESTRECSRERMEQFEVTCEHMALMPDKNNVIFACDSNLRDWEYKKSCQNSDSAKCEVIDCWMQLGSPDDSRYTWDTTCNDNVFEDGTARLRFERVFMRSVADSKTHLVPKSLELIGKERLPCGMFISDHWGMFLTFSLPDKPPFRPKAGNPESTTATNAKKDGKELDFCLRIEYKPQ